MRYTEVPHLLTKDKREKFVEDVMRVVIASGSMAWDLDRHRIERRQHVLSFKGPKLSVSLWVSPSVGRWDQAPILHWHNAKAKLKGVRGAWSGLDVNPYHRLKATSFPKDLNQCLSMLSVGIKAEQDGSAFMFDPEPPAS